jgi:uncharacterized protein YkwD
LILKRLYFLLPPVRVSAVTALTIAVLAACGGGSDSSDSHSTSNQGGTGSTNAGDPTGSLASSQKVTLLPPASAPQNVSATGDATADSIAFVSAVRHNVGLNQLTVDQKLVTSSLNHANYLVLNQATGHNETQGLPGYTGQSPFTRSDAVFGEVTIAGDIRAFATSLTGVTSLFDAPFHRFLMLEGYASLGVGASTSATWEAVNIDFGGYSSVVGDTQLVAYPYSGQTGVPARWFAAENPNPFASQPQYQNTYVGYPVTIQAKLTGHLSSVSIKLTDSGGNDVPCFQPTPDGNAEITNGAMCIPYTALKGNTAYSVHVTGVLKALHGDTHPIDVTWSFTTEADASAKVLGGEKQFHVVPE